MLRVSVRTVHLDQQIKVATGSHVRRRCVRADYYLLRAIVRNPSLPEQNVLPRRESKLLTWRGEGEAEQVTVRGDNYLLY